VPAIIALVKDEQQLETFKNNIAKLAITNADEVVAKNIIQSITQDQAAA
jgi:hypothetical protein